VFSEGDVVGGFEVLEVPGHSRGALAFWRESDRVLICGDVMANLGLRPGQPQIVLAPSVLSWDPERNKASARRLIELRPQLVCFGHGLAVTDPGRFNKAADEASCLPHTPPGASVGDEAATRR
jgi:hydroxyacylglutathione hydrolase